MFFFARIAVYVYQSFGFCKQTRRSAVLYDNDTLPVKSIYIQSFGYEKRSDMYQYRAVNALNSHYVVIEWILQCFQKQQHPWRRRGYLGVLMISATNYDIYNLSDFFNYYKVFFCFKHNNNMKLNHRHIKRCFVK